jgi:hypothetical protein
MTKPEKRRAPAAFHLSDEARQLLQALAKEQGISMTAMLEVLIRAEAERKGLR